jgi:hypothetical protein
MLSFRHKAGATLSFSGVSRTSAGTPINLTGYTVTSQFRAGNALTLAGTATVTLADQGTDPGEFTLSVPASTTVDWTGNVVFDLRFSIGSTVIHTETVLVEVVPRITTS